MVLLNATEPMKIALAAVLGEMRAISERTFIMFSPVDHADAKSVEALRSYQEGFTSISFADLQTLSLRFRALVQLVIVSALCMSLFFICYAQPEAEKAVCGACGRGYVHELARGCIFL
jgi:hypothetical protein